MINVGKTELKKFVHEYIKENSSRLEKEEIKEAINNNIYSPQMEDELDKIKEEFSLYVADNDYEIISLNADNLDRIKRVAKRYVDVDLEDDLINEYLQGILERINCNE